MDISQSFVGNITIVSQPLCSQQLLREDLKAENMSFKTWLYHAVDDHTMADTNFFTVLRFLLVCFVTTVQCKIQLQNI